MKAFTSTGKFGESISLRRLMHQAGLSAEDARLAADMAERDYRQKRDEFLAQALSANISVRNVARIWKVSKSGVQRIADAMRSTGGPNRDTGKHYQQRAANGKFGVCDHEARLFSLREALIFTTLGKRTFEKLVRAGELPPPVKIGERRLAWRLRDLVAWAESRPVIVSFPAVPRRARTGTATENTLSSKEIPCASST